MELVPIKFVEVAENKAILTLQLQSEEGIAMATFDVDYFIEPNEDPTRCGWEVMMFNGHEVKLDVEWKKCEVTTMVSDFDRRNGGF